MAINESLCNSVRSTFPDQTAPTACFLLCIHKASPVKHKLKGNCLAGSSSCSASVTFDVYRSVVVNTSVAHRLAPFP